MSELLQVKNLSKIYKTAGGSLSVRKSSVSALEGVSFSVSQGQTLGIVGESGCGKSTLLKTLNGDSPASEGKVFLFDQELLSNYDYLKTQIGSPEGADSPNKKHYDPRKWLREGELTFIKRLEEAFKDLNAINTL